MDESKGRTPFRTEDIEGNFTIRVDVGVVDLGNEAAIRWVKRVIRMKLNVKQEHATLIRGFIWSQNHGLADVWIIHINGPSRAVWWGIPGNIFKIFFYLPQTDRFFFLFHY